MAGSMMKRSAEQVLRAHVIERMRRASVASRDMETSCTGVDESTHLRMGEDAWTESCRLTRGVDERLWAVLTILWCGWDETVNERQARAARGESKYWPHGAGEAEAVGSVTVVSQVAATVSRQMACAGAGVSYSKMRKWYVAALMQVAENQARGT